MPENFEMIDRSALLEKVGALKREGWRLVQICVTRLPEQFELTYSFDREDRLTHLRLHLLPTDARVDSITSTYWCAFLYENEMHDLFGIRVDGINVDFQGNFYKTAVKFPFGSTKPPTPKPAPAPKAPASQPAVTTPAAAATT